MDFNLIAALLATAGAAGYVNHRWLRLPPTIGLMAIALAVSAALAAVSAAGIVDATPVRNALQKIDFAGLLLHGMLAYLLFAGALHVDVAKLRSEAWAIALLATLGVAITTLVVGALFWLAGRWLGLELPLVHALLFGALIAPTDPIAVLGIMDRAGAPESLRTRITGESLFNDGVGVVVFLTVVQLATASNPPDWGEAAATLAKEVTGALVLGFAAGYLVYRMLARIDAYRVEVLLTVGLAAGVYALAEVLSFSAPITVVVAGLVIGNHGRSHAMSDQTRANLDTFWEIVDDTLNSLLFMLIGLEVLLLHLEALGSRGMLLAAASIVIVLAGRLAGVALPLGVLAKPCGFERGMLRVLTWSGLRGGISIALALSLPGIPQRHLVLVCTYAVVVFSLLGQGLTLERVIRSADE